LNFFKTKIASQFLVFELETLDFDSTVNCLVKSTQKTCEDIRNASLQEFVLLFWDRLLNHSTDLAGRLSTYVTDGLWTFIYFSILTIDPDKQFLQARGHTLAATIARTMPSRTADNVLGLLDIIIDASTSDPSQVVRITALKSLEDYVCLAQLREQQRLQAKVVVVVCEFLYKNYNSNKSHQVLSLEASPYDIVSIFNKLPGAF
jgi:hypothetical protein